MRKSRCAASGMPFVASRHRRRRLSWLVGYRFGRAGCTSVHHWSTISARCLDPCQGDTIPCSARRPRRAGRCSQVSSGCTFESPTSCYQDLRRMSRGGNPIGRTGARPAEMGLGKCPCQHCQRGVEPLGGSTHLLRAGYARLKPRFRARFGAAGWGFDRRAEERILVRFGRPSFAGRFQERACAV